MSVSRLLSACSLAAFSLPVCSGEVLVPRGSETSWQYLDAGQRAGEAWAAVAFDASQWKSGPAPLGYGEKDMATTVSFGANEMAKPVATYFRHTLEVPDPAKVETIIFHLRRDDGAVVYWNGKEVARSNMPAGEITPDTLAPVVLNDALESIFHVYVVPVKGTVLKGRNVIAVEVHQCEPASSDLIFDLEAVAYAPGEALPGTTYYADAMAALHAGDFDRAFDLILNLDSARNDYFEFMRGAIKYFASRNEVPDEHYFTLVDKVYTAAPNEMEFAYSWVRARVDARRDLPVKPVRRSVPAVPPQEFRFIADTPPGGNAPEAGKLIPRSKLLEDVDDLELILENCYAYLERRGANYQGALDALRASITGDLRQALFAHRVSRMLTVFGDPLSDVIVDRENGPHLPEVRLPALLVMDGTRLAAVTRDHTGFLVPGFPYIAEISGRPVKDWIAAAEHIVPQASPQYRLRLALGQLRDIPAVARELSLPGNSNSAGSAIFESADGKEKKTVELKSLLLPRGTGVRPDWPDTRSQIIKNDIGYLRIPEMTGEGGFISSLNDSMQKFDDTRGLIIDVRGNNGATQHAIQTLLPWFMKPGSPMKIINVAAYRLPLKLPKENPPGGFLALDGRALYPVSSPVWTRLQAAEIDAFLKSWKPRWKLPDGKFTNWHFMGVSRESNPAAGFYDKPVIVLLDERCLSATDIFLGAFKGHPNVTLMGTPSGGGSGRVANYRLPHSGVRLTLCQMASFAASGLTYDGFGVTPDVPMTAKLDDQIDGRGDSVLEAAVARLKK